MEVNNLRAIRRRHAARLKRNRRGNHGSYVEHLPNEEQALHLGRFVHTMPACSCQLCGNPRKYFGQVTLKEQSDLEMIRFE